MIFVCLNYVPDIVIPWPNKGKICHSVYIIFFEVQLNLEKRILDNLCFEVDTFTKKNIIININNLYLNQNS